MRRRAFLALPLALLPAQARANAVAYPAVTPEFRLDFPRDHGAHPHFRQEWWYVTGSLATSRGETLGFQVTFFRARPDFSTANPGRMVPRQIILAHAALADGRHGRLRHEDRAGRASLGLAGADEGTTRVWVDGWRLELVRNAWRTRIAAREFALDLEIRMRRLPVANGHDGYSQKGPGAGEASYYYSVPHLVVSGSVERAGARQEVSGTAWLDHEWSSQYMPAAAEGWDWIGLNLDDGGALMAFRMRKGGGAAPGSDTLYAGGTLLSPQDVVRVLAPDQVAFEPLRRWRSPRTGTTYPVAMKVAILGREWLIEPMMDDQELDARASTGTIYWEGAVGAKLEGTTVGRGYLELTGYWRPMRL
ncbi:MAG: carotenoid 1,2-hydratase [Betaproteobacteria bacterium]|nr:carotenoid 1,2-hydratase [Betaproteobacteria bacterium]